MRPPSPQIWSIWLKSGDFKEYCTASADRKLNTLPQAVKPHCG
jgi:hypothetical protein